MIQAAFFDIDGTLLDHTDGKSIFPDSTAAALAALQRKGIKVFISTGRACSIIGQVTEVFPFDGYVTTNGQIVMERDGTMIRHEALDPRDVCSLVSLARDGGYPTIILEDAASYPVNDHPFIRRHFEWSQTPFPPFYDIARLEEHPVVQINVYMPLDQAEKLFTHLEHLAVTSSGGDILDVIPRGGGKEVGLSAAAQYYGIKQQDTIAFGDGPNDINMLQWAGIGVAMGNGTPEVKAVADYVTTSVSEDGIKNALLHLGILTGTDF